MWIGTGLEGAPSEMETARDGDRQGELELYLYCLNFSYENILAKSSVLNREPARPKRSVSEKMRDSAVTLCNLGQSLGYSASLSLSVKCGNSSVKCLRFL